MISDSGIDTSVFKAHSVRGATISAASMQGVTTEDILKAADCRGVLSHPFIDFIINLFIMPHWLGQSCHQLQTTQLICETEPSEI